MVELVKRVETVRLAQPVQSVQLVAVYSLSRFHFVLGGLGE